jgi:hypothetical protein
MWVPGYWHYGPFGYYWVPGTWVPAPAPGLLWTPGYWGFVNGAYIFHDGYWGRHIGYYGGVNYGFGYGGIGFAGGEWRGGHFAYNTAVINVNTTVIHTTYVDRTIVERNTIVNPGHVAYSGGPGGVHHDPAPEERMAEHEQHQAPTAFQQQHIAAAKADTTSYAKNNGGHPQNLAVAKPLAAGSHPAPVNHPETGMKAMAPGSHLGEAATPRSKSGQDAWGSQTKAAAPPAKPNTPQGGNTADWSQVKSHSNTNNNRMEQPASNPVPAAHPAPPPHPAPAAHPAPPPRPAPPAGTKPEPKPKK